MKLVHVYGFDYVLKNNMRYSAKIAAFSKEEAEKYLITEVGKVMIEGRSVEARIDALTPELEKVILNKYDDTKPKTEKKKEKKKEPEKKQIENTKEEESIMEGNFICTECGFEAKNDFGLQRHISAKHT